jgi:uracil-DNA glycosylase
MAGSSDSLASSPAPEFVNGPFPNHANRPLAQPAFMESHERVSAFDRLRGRIQACARCPKLAASRSRVVPGHGAIPAEVAFVGLAPGRFGGDRTGIPFEGDRSGDLLRRTIRHTRLSAVFITNLVRCNPRDERGRNRDPDAGEIANCRDYLVAELALARPRIVVPLGRIAWRALAGHRIPFTPGAPAIIASGTLMLYPMYHPAYVIRGAYPERAYRRDFARLAKLMRTI